IRSDSSGEIEVREVEGWAMVRADKSPQIGTLANAISFLSIRSHVLFDRSESMNSNGSARIFRRTGRMNGARHRRGARVSIDIVLKSWASMRGIPPERSWRIFLRTDRRAATQSRALCAASGSLNPPKTRSLGGFTW